MYVVRVLHRALDETIGFWSLHRTLAFFSGPIGGILLRGLVKGWRLMTDGMEILLLLLFGYAFAWLISFLVNLIRTPALLDADRQTQINDLQKQLDDERSTASNLGRRIEQLEWPPDRPKIAFLDWREVEAQELPPDHHPAMLSQRGFHLFNDGGVALEVRVEDFMIGTTQAKSRIISRIDSHSRGFIPVWLETPSPVLKWEHLHMLKQVAETEIEAHRMPYGHEYRIPIRITYRDFNNLWYSSEADLIFHHHLGRIEFGSVTQSKLGCRASVE